MTHPLIKKIFLLATQTITYKQGEGALCPFCRRRMNTTGTRYRDAYVVKRDHSCPDCCPFPMHSEEKLVPPPDGTVPTPLPKRKKKHKDNSRTG